MTLELEINEHGLVSEEGEETFILHSSLQEKLDSHKMEIRVEFPEDIEAKH